MYTNPEELSHAVNFISEDLDVTMLCLSNRLGVKVDQIHTPDLEKLENQILEKKKEDVKDKNEKREGGKDHNNVKKDDEKEKKQERNVEFYNPVFRPPQYHERVGSPFSRRYVPDDVSDDDLLPSHDSPFTPIRLREKGSLNRPPLSRYKPDSYKFIASANETPAFEEDLISLAAKLRETRSQLQGIGGGKRIKGGVTTTTVEGHNNIPAGIPSQQFFTAQVVPSAVPVEVCLS